MGIGDLAFDLSPQCVCVCVCVLGGGGGGREGGLPCYLHKQQCNKNMTLEISRFFFQMGVPAVNTANKCFA